jgi:hypothetical protein
MAKQGPGLLAAFDHVDATVEAIEKLRAAGFEKLTAYAPFPEHNIEHAMGYKESPVRVFTLVGGLTGAATGFAFTIFSVTDWPLITGGKPLLSIPAFVVIAKFKPAVVYDPEFSSGRFGVYVTDTIERLADAQKILEAAQPAELRSSEGGLVHA